MFNLVFKIFCTVILSVFFIVHLIGVITSGESDLDFYIMPTIVITVVTLWVPISLPHTIVLVCLWTGLLVRSIVTNWGNWSCDTWAAWIISFAISMSLVVDCITRYNHV